MDFRATYATIMIRRHVQLNNENESKLFRFRAMEEEYFTVMLLCVRNAGVEKIRPVCAAASHENYANYVARVTDIVRKDEGSEQG